MDVKDYLDRLTPETERLQHWDAVLQDARPSRVRWAAPRLAIVGAVVALAALVAVAPWRESQPTGILDRALAAVGDGEVLHVVFRGEWGGTVVDLESGARRPVYGDRELWYDAERMLVHEILRFGGVVEHEEVYDTRRREPNLAALSHGYREVLESGTARVAGEDVVGGVPVFWITVHSELLPDVGDGRDHEWAQQVAVSKKTYEPVATRETRDGKGGEGTLQNILELQMVSREAADLTGSPEASLDGRAFSEGRVPITLDAAPGALGRTPYWLGPEHKGLALAQVARLEAATGAQAKRLLRGEEAARARECLSGLRKGAAGASGRPAACRSLPYGLEGRGEKIYALGRARFGDVQTGVVIFYGTLGDDPTTYGQQAVPQADEPHVTLIETTSRNLPARGTPMRYVPPLGTVVVTARRFGLLVLDGVYVRIEAANEDAVIEAARALRPVNAGSGAGG